MNEDQNQATTGTKRKARQISGKSKKKEVIVNENYNLLLYKLL